MSNDIFDEIFASVFIPESLASPIEIIPSNILASKLKSRELALKHAQKRAKNRDRMRKQRMSERATLNQLNAQVEALTRQLHQLLNINNSNKAESIQSIQNLQHILINKPKFPRDIQRIDLIRSYMYLVAISERLRLENEQNEQTLHKVWGRYINFINHQVNDLYGANSSPRPPPSTNYRTQHAISCEPTPPDRLRLKPFRPSVKGQWVSFAFSPKMDEIGHEKNILLFRESTDDIYFRHISDSMCKKLQAEAYEEGVSYTKVFELEVKSGNRPSIKEIEYLGWRVTYYPITTQEAYPHLTQVTDLEITNAKGNLIDMIRYDFVKRYKLKPHQDFNSVFTHIRELTWKMLLAPITSAGLHFTLDTMIGRVLQTINDQTCIVIRSFMSTNSPMIYRIISLMHQYENEVLVTMLNPRHCISRIDDRNEIKVEDETSSGNGREEVFWVTHGHCRFGWYKVSNQEYEVRFGGSIVLREYSLEAKIKEYGELIANWEKKIFQEPTILPSEG